MLLAFWVPVLALTFLISYRRPRFMYFAYPMWVTAQAGGLLLMAHCCREAFRRPALWRTVLAVLIALFGARLAWSGARLLGDTLETASGAHVTLARRHPQWREPAAYVRDRLDEDTRVIGTTWLPLWYYVGRVDTWYPSRAIPWEVTETGDPGLRDLAELRAYLTEHPRGYFLAEFWRWQRWASYDAEAAAELAWVEQHLHRVDAASNADVTVYAWDFRNRDMLE